MPSGERPARALASVPTSPRRAPSPPAPFSNAAASAPYRYGVLGFAAALLGGLAVRCAARRDGGSAFIVFAIALVLGVSTLLMLWVGVRDHLDLHGHGPRHEEAPPPEGSSSLHTLCMV